TSSDDLDNVATLSHRLHCLSVESRKRVSKFEATQFRIHLEPKGMQCVHLVLKPPLESICFMKSKRRKPKIIRYINGVNYQNLPVLIDNNFVTIFEQAVRQSSIRQIYTVNCYHTSTASADLAQRYTCASFSLKNSRLI
ncbi:hypothetical protein PENTCL1PPCAC_23937, partial [Pristionchus entomophagus]